MRVVIVGHGPSLYEQEHGDWIDDNDIVIRMKFPPKEQKHFGSKTSIMGGSLTIVDRVFNLPGDKKWIFFDSRHDKIPQTEIDTFINRVFPRGTVQYNVDLCNEWDAIYRSLRKPTTFSKRMRDSNSCDELGERHLSQGFKAILYAAYFLKPLKLRLVGFDNIRHGEFTWSVTRGDTWENYPKHRWDVEHDMLDMVQKRFQMGISFRR